MCEHDSKGKGMFLEPRHGPARALDKGCFLSKFGEKGVHLKTFMAFKGYILLYFPKIFLGHP